MLDIIFNFLNTVIPIGGYPLSILELACMLSGFTCVFLAGRNLSFNFWVGYVYCILLFLLFAQKHFYSAMLLQPISFAISVYGHWRWTHPAKEERSNEDVNILRITRLTIKEIGLYIIFTLVFAAIWGFVLSNLGTNWFVGVFSPDPHPYFDASLLALTLLALYLSAQKKLECWYVWIAVNVVNIVIYLSAGLRFMPTVSALYLVNALWALINWTKLYKKGN